MSEATETPQAEHAWSGDPEKFGAAFEEIVAKKAALLEVPRPASTLADAVQRLREAQHTPDQKMERFADWLLVWCKREASLPLNTQHPVARAMTLARKRVAPQSLDRPGLAILKRQFAESLWVEVFPPDIVAACRAVPNPNKIVLDLEQGSNLAPWTHFSTGEPVTVHIYSWQLDHLLSLLPDPLPS